MATVISTQGTKRPAPRWWRNFERGMLLIIIPTTVLAIQGWGFKDDLVVIRATLIVNVVLGALIKFIGMMLVDTEDNYVSNLPESVQNKIPEINTPPVDTKE